ncbi:protein FAR1-RELATED SEQUENCE 11-like [Papaver somniferum]|uniref:protein FAR1-RELATED SEQUENCE 11-like n=1 Tax=Papaver somniferum TaxID=3469 RepID=UPI000E6F6565|nr:protein FAR1-RELATED SEQUENCE 11-like [Papaver somniferum]
MDEPPNTFTCGDDQVQSDETEAMNHSSNGKNDVSNLEIPYEGMHFNTHEEAQENCTEYRRRNGFSVRVQSTNKTRVGVDEVTSVYMVCAREGKKKKEQNIEGIDKKGRSCNTIKCECKAKIRFIFDEERSKWIVTIFSDEHNHKFVSPSKRKRMRINRCMPDDAKDLTEAFNRENIQISKVPSIFGGADIGLVEEIIGIIYAM